MANVSTSVIMNPVVQDISDNLPTEITLRLIVLYP